MAKHQITVTLYFDDKGQLKDVDPGGPPRGEGEDPEKIKKEILAGPGEPMSVKSILEKDHSRLNFCPFLYEFGSPGCVTFQTQAGLIRICWPQS